MDTEQYAKHMSHHMLTEVRDRRTLVPHINSRPAPDGPVEERKEPMSDTTASEPNRPTVDWESVKPSHLFQDIARLRTEEPVTVARELNQKYGTALPLLLVSLFTDLLTASLDPEHVDEWLDLAPEGEGQVVAGMIRQLRGANNPTAEVAAIQKVDETFKNMSPISYAITLVALVKLFAQPTIQTLLAGYNHGTLDSQYDSFFGTPEGQEFKAAVDALQVDDDATEQSA